MASGSARKQIMRQMSQEKSMQSKMKNINRNQIPDDLGLFPDTLIKPEPKDLPSLFSTKIQRRLRIEWRAFFQKFRDFGTTVYMMKFGARKDPITRKRPREPLLLAERYHMARELHRQLYKALARGDRETISTIACKGLQNALKTRLDQRRAVNGPEESWSIEYTGWTAGPVISTTWRFEKISWLLQALIPPMFKSTRVITDRFGQLPFGRDARLRQVIVKIRSKQTLDKNDGTAPKTKDVEEYVVIQKMRIDGEDGEWMIWGTTQPSTEKQIDELFNAKKERLSAWDEMKNQVLSGQKS